MRNHDLLGISIWRYDEHHSTLNIQTHVILRLRLVSSRYFIVVESILMGATRIAAPCGKLVINQQLYDEQRMQIRKPLQ